MRMLWQVQRTEITFSLLWPMKKNKLSSPVFCGHFFSVSLFLRRCVGMFLLLFFWRQTSQQKDPLLWGGYHILQDYVQIMINLFCTFSYWFSCTPRFWDRNSIDLKKGPFFVGCSHCILKGILSEFLHAFKGNIVHLLQYNNTVLIILFPFFQFPMVLLCSIIPFTSFSSPLVEGDFIVLL